MLRGFRNFLMRGDVIVVSIGLVVALAFSNLVKAFTDSIINPLVAAAQGGVKGPGLGWQLVSGGSDATFLNLGAFISAIIYFIIFMALVYFRDRDALQSSHGSLGQNSVWRPSSDEDLSRLSFRRPEPRGDQVQALRFGYRGRDRLSPIKASLQGHTASYLFARAFSDAGKCH